MEFRFTAEEEAFRTEVREFQHLLDNWQRCPLPIAERSSPQALRVRGTKWPQVHFFLSPAVVCRGQEQPRQ